MKKPLALLVLLLLLSGAAAVEIGSHTIEIKVDKEGYAHIIETYQLVFESPFEFREFKVKAEENSSSRLAWMADFNWFYTRFGESANNDVEVSFITFDEINRNLTLDYWLENTFATLIKDEPRETFWSIEDRQLVDFQEGGSINVPQNTRILIILPLEVEINTAQLSSKANAVGNTVELSGIRTNYINLQYTIRKPITSPIGPFEIIQNLFGETSNIVFLGILLIVLILAAWKRKEIGGKIEDYIVEHSKLESIEEEEEIELEA